eukprot:6466368-Alexandrium_andersonii.AAC.1
MDPVGQPQRAARARARSWPHDTAQTQTLPITPLRTSPTTSKAHSSQACHHAPRTAHCLIAH